VVSFLLDSPPNPCTYFFPPYVPHVPPITFFLILTPEQYFVMSTDHGARYFNITCSLLVLPPSKVQTSCSAAYTRTRQPMFFPQLEDQVSYLYNDDINKSCSHVKQNTPFVVKAAN
jgi:hypothetical protein